MSTSQPMDVSERAYAIWQREGCPDGTALDNWLQAEAELSRELALKTTSNVRRAPPSKRKRG
jgi:hypothetical protein